MYSVFLDWGVVEGGKCDEHLVQSTSYGGYLRRDDHRGLFVWKEIIL